MKRSKAINSRGLNYWFEGPDFRWTLVMWNNKFAIYKQVDLENSKTYYEVWRIRFRKERILHGRLLKGAQRFPSDEEFERHAWFAPTYEKALMIYNARSGRKEGVLEN